MSEESIVFQLLEEDRKVRLERIVEDRKITTDDCLVLGILKLHREMEVLHKRIDDTNKRIDDTNKRMATNFKWTISLILGLWASMLAILMPILLKVSSM